MGRGGFEPMRKMVATLIAVLLSSLTLSPSLT